jgi:hypothetical protein
MTAEKHLYPPALAALYFPPQEENDLNSRTDEKRRKSSNSDAPRSSLTPGQPDFDEASGARIAPSRGHDFSRISPFPPEEKVTVSRPGDPPEKEADQVADEIMGLGTGKTSSKTRTMQPGRSAKISVSGGEPLDNSTRNFFEPRFGHNFSNVRVHADSQAGRAAASVAARAYTLGDDIVFGSGQYAPGTPEGRHLLAHELTHTLQQSDSPALVQRAPGNASVMPPNSSSASTPPMSVAPPSAGGDNPSPPPAAAAKSVVYKGKTLHSEPASAKKMLQDMVAADGFKATMTFLDDLSNLIVRDQDFKNAFKADEAETAKLCINATNAERAGLENDKNAVLTAFEAQAQEKTKVILAESEKRINEERERYGIPEPKFMHDKESGQDIDLTPKKMADNDATKAMAAAAKEMVGPRRNLERHLKRYDACFETTTSNNEVPGMATKRVISGKEAEAQEFEGYVKQARDEVSILRNQIERQFPILATYGPESEANTDSLENIARGAESQGLAFWRKNAIDELVPMIAEKLHNIKIVRESLADGSLNIWSSETIVSGTKAEQGFGSGSWQARIVDEKVKDIHDREFLVNLFVGAVAIALGLVAIFATAGTATAVVATTGSAILSGGQAVHSLGNYLEAKAQSGTDFDKARAISQEDPSLFWLALDIIGAVLDVKAAISSFKVLAPAIREALATGKSPEALGKLGKILDKFDPVMKQKILMHITGAAHAGTPVLEEMEKIARAQYKALADAGRLKEIGDVSEEVFVKQMLSGARAHMIISGEQGIRRSGLVAALMQPGNERIAAILKGDVKAIDALIVEHGNWKQLLGMLEQGTPEMRQAAAKLFERRQSLLPQLESKFNAKPVSGASSEKISDIDLSTYGENAGSDLIAAEKHMQGLYGPGWSEALRMNFYTEAGRLTLYEKIMPNLSKAEQAKLLGELTADAEKLNIAKMLAHAEGNPARLAEVEAYAKKIGVDIKDPKIQELVPKLAGGGDVAARNKLLLEIDELMKKYNAAAPGSQEQIDLAKTITKKQMEANALTAEAYVGTGAGRMTVSGVKVIGHEAYQAALSNLEMIQHIMHEVAGDVVTASREYEIYKYMNRFAEAAENAGAKTQGLDYWKNFSGFASKTERGATSGAVHLGPRPNATVPKGGQPFLPDTKPNIGPVSDQFLLNQYEAWKAFSEQALIDVKKIAQDQPSAWAGFNPLRPAAGAAGHL